MCFSKISLVQNLSDILKKNDMLLLEALLLPLVSSSVFFKIKDLYLFLVFIRGAHVSVLNIEGDISLVSLLKLMHMSAIHRNANWKWPGLPSNYSVVHCDEHYPGNASFPWLKRIYWINSKPSKVHFICVTHGTNHTSASEGFMNCKPLDAL